MIRAFRKRIGASIAAGALLALAAGGAGATTIKIGGTDAETQFNRVGAPILKSPGVLTFDDEFNGFNSSEPGVVTSADPVVAALLGKAVDFEVALDTSGFDPATGNVRNAAFIGTGAGPELMIRDGNIVLLAFQVNFIKVSQAPHSGSPLGSPDGKILLGNPTADTFGVSSNLTVAGGTLNLLVGGNGTHAVMELLMSSLNPEMTKALRNSGYLDLNFTNGVGTSAVSATWNLEIDVPEPASAALLGMALVAALAAARRGATRP